MEKIKARSVGKELRQKGIIDYFDTYALVARLSTIRVHTVIASIYNLVVHQMDVKTTFLHGDLNEEIYVHQPEGFSSE